jgi:hypothetical protein
LAVFKLDNKGNRLTLAVTIGTTIDFVEQLRLTKVTRPAISGGSPVSNKMVKFTYTAASQMDSIDLRVSPGSLFAQRRLPLSNLAKRSSYPVTTLIRTTRPCGEGCVLQVGFPRSMARRLVGLMTGQSAITP